MQGIICLGDSITYGVGEVPSRSWSNRLKNHFEDNPFKRTYNLGVPGDTTVSLKHRIDTEIKSRLMFKEDQDNYLVIISIGINDTKGTNTTDNIQVPIDIFKENLKELIDITKKHVKNIVFLSQTPVNEDLTMPIQETKYYSNEKIENYNKIIEEINKNNNCYFCDVGNYIKSKNYKQLLYDGIHPNSKGYDEMYNYVREFLDKNNLI